MDNGRGVVVSIVFLICYLVYHFQVGHVKFEGPEPIRTAYHLMLLSHVLLAATVRCWLAVRCFWVSADRRIAHKRWANWAFPIWLYVSVTAY